MTLIKSKTWLLALISLGMVTSCSEEEKDVNNIETNIVNIDTTTVNQVDTAISKLNDSSLYNEIVPIGRDKDSVIKEIEKNIPTTDNTIDVISINNKKDTVTATDTKTVNNNQEINKTKTPELFNHQLFDGLLRKYVSSTGKVNYKGFKTEKAKLEKYVKQLQTEYSALKSWSKNKQLAFWINVYNAHTIKLILDNYPVSSIKDINGGKPWDKMFIQLGGKSYSLNNVENDIIRKRYKEARIHFAVNCAAVSCPKLMNQAFTESNLNRKLTQMTKEFLANTAKNQLSKDEIKISKIFEWYMTDFTKSSNIIPFIQKYANTEINDDAKVSYNNYNWDLND